MKQNISPIAIIGILVVTALVIGGAYMFFMNRTPPAPPIPMKVGNSLPKGKEGLPGAEKGAPGTPGTMSPSLPGGGPGGMTAPSLPGGGGGGGMTSPAMPPAPR